MPDFKTKIKQLAPSFSFINGNPIEYFGLYLKFGAWIKENEKKLKKLESRPALFKYLNENILGFSAIDYLEFGVYKGDSIKIWLEENKNPDSRFYGFDTFEGLPEDWSTFVLIMKKGTFDVKGETPQFTDERVEFIKGLFQDTLPMFLANYHSNNRLVIHLDADLYSSTLFVLTSMNHLLKPGTILMFDEFDGANAEFKALLDYQSAFMRKVKPIATAGASWNHTALEIIE